MLSLGRFPWQVQSYVLQQPKEPSSQFSQICWKPAIPVSWGSNFRDFLAESRTGLRCNASKTKKRSGYGVTEKGIPEEMDEDSDVEFDEGDESDADDEVFVPLENMKKWEANKPRGFGEGKVYDTSIEDKLMEEIEQSRKAQRLNLIRLKKEAAMKPATKKNEGDLQVQGSTKMEDCGYQVRLLNLPKKKNIGRDLQLAFSGVPGILNILPVVSGNKKTRDPICKGLAVVNFKHADQAHRFVQSFSGKSIVFGKVEKQIKCEVISPKSPEDASDEVDDGSLQDSVDEHRLSVADSDEEEIRENSSTTIDDDSSLPQLDVAKEASTSSWEQEPKKPTSNRRKRHKTPRTKNIILGAANRLKTREKAMLSGVLTKYGANSAATSTSVEVISSE